MTSHFTQLWACDKTIFRIGIPTQRKFSNEKKRILCKILWFSWQEQIQKIKLFQYYTEKNQNKNWKKLSSFRQEPTFKAPITTATDDIHVFFHHFSEKIRLDISSDSSARQRIHMKNQAVFSLKDKS